MSSNRKFIPDRIDVYVGERIKRRRKEIGLSQKSLGDLLGITFQQIQKYEGATNRVSASRLYEISNVLNVSIKYFYEKYEIKYVVNKKNEDVKIDLHNMVINFVKTNEGMKLNKAFNEINNNKIRSEIIKLVISIVVNAK